MEEKNGQRIRTEQVGRGRQGQPLMKGMRKLRKDGLERTRGEEVVANRRGSALRSESVTRLISG